MVAQGCGWREGEQDRFEKAVTVNYSCAPSSPDTSSPLPTSTSSQLHVIKGSGPRFWPPAWFPEIQNVRPSKGRWCLDPTEKLQVP